MKERIKKMVIGFLIIVISIILDQLTKYLARTHLESAGSITIIKGFFNLTYVENRGAAWGMLSGKLWLFYVITFVSLFVMGYLFKDFNIKDNALYSIGLALVIGGTIGNFIDRAIFKYVTDMFDFYIFGYNFPVFNIADICLTCGVFLIVIKLIFFSKAGVE